MANIQNEARDSTIIYRSFYEAIIELQDKNQAELWRAIFEYSLNFEQIELTGLSKTIFTLIKPQLDANIQRYKNGKKPKGKQRKSVSEANNKQDQSKSQTNKNGKENPNLNLNQKENETLLHINDLRNDFLKDKEMCNHLYEKFKISDETELKGMLEKFHETLKNGGHFKKTRADYYSHFTSSLKKYIIPGDGGEDTYAGLSDITVD